MLFEIIKNGDDEDLKEFLNNDSTLDLEIKNKYGYTPLLLAVKEGRTKMVKILLKADVNVNAKTRKGCTALTLAVNKSRTPIIKMLLKSSIDIHAVNSNGNTALTLAIRAGRKGISKLILEASLSQSYTPESKRLVTTAVKNEIQRLMTFL